MRSIRGIREKTKMNSQTPVILHAHTKEIDPGNQTVASQPSIMLRNDTARRLAVAGKAREYKSLMSFGAKTFML
ncbi:hypothetical protein Syun_001997 [Stephania yunnanensis]|uniref:Uncharacterized protein n=1 Tax=Stephania yunnanensis TaxID=152371 RepID=A0AAP0LEN2_9MAGN